MSGILHFHHQCASGRVLHLAAHRTGGVPRFVADGLDGATDPDLDEYALWRVLVADEVMRQLSPGEIHACALHAINLYHPSNE